jgi:hypothetical protein
MGRHRGEKSGSGLMAVSSATAPPMLIVCRAEVAM